MTSLKPAKPARRLRVLHISGRSDHGGGPEHLLQVLAATLPRIEHFVACPSSGVYWKRYLDLLGENRLCTLPHRSLSIRYFFQLRAFTAASGIQVIHSHGTCAGVYGRLLGLFTGLPVVHTFHGVPVTRSLKHELYNFSERLLCRITHCGVSVSAGEADLVHRRWQHYLGKLAVVPNGIDLGTTASAWAHWPATESLRIVSFTRLNHQKHPEMLIEIARILHLQGMAFQIDAYGEGLLDSSLHHEAMRRGVGHHVHFHGPTDNPTAALAGAHVYLSTSRWEGMPLAVLEAWRAGLVVVASDVVGNRDLIQDRRTGRLYPSGNGRTAARIIRSLHANPTTALRYRDQAAESAKIGHCRNLMAMRLEWIYQHVNEVHEGKTAGAIAEAAIPNSASTTTTTTANAGFNAIANHLNNQPSP